MHCKGITSDRRFHILWPITREHGIWQLYAHWQLWSTHQDLSIDTYFDLQRVRQFPTDLCHLFSVFTPYFRNATFFQIVSIDNLSRLVKTFSKIYSLLGNQFRQKSNRIWASSFNLTIISPLICTLTLIMIGNVD